MAIDIEKLYNELNDKYSILEEELTHYKDKFLPKFEVGDKLIAVDTKDKKLVDIVIDEIVMNKFEVSYRNYVGENEMYQFPEQFCFQTKLDAENLLAQQ